MCQPKAKVSTELIENAYNNKDWSNDPTLMCYMDCIIQNFRLFKKGELDLDSAIQQVQQLPEARKVAMEKSVRNCKDKAVGTKKCEAAYEFAKCLYFDNPENYCLP
nr:odorant-binding protein [Lasioderma serricorne]